LATLLFAIAAFSTTGGTHPLPRDAKELLVVALVFFVVAGFLALLTNMPMQYEVANVTTTLNRSQRDPSDDQVEALRWSARVYAKALKDANGKNPSRSNPRRGTPWRIACECSSPV
jgi:type VI protein secretion system component VasK